MYSTCRSKNTRITNDTVCKKNPKKPRFKKEGRIITISSRFLPARVNNNSRDYLFERCMYCQERVTRMNLIEAQTEKGYSSSYLHEITLACQNIMYNLSKRFTVYTFLCKHFGFILRKLFVKL